uniref:P-type ATPase C-terminal domain-containing protein n=1 Tax=Guillardia theta TaxID=55529 RepID=A0A6U6BDB5_GUITH
MGNEGMQAARSSDFAIGEFRHLKKLLAVHGRHSCLRTSELIKYSFFKNICFCSPQVVYFFYTLFSSTTIYSAWIILGFNIIFTGLPPFALAIFEKDLTHDVISLYPELYCTSDRKQPLSLWSFFVWELQAFLQGVVLTLGIIYSMASFQTAPYVEDGKVASADGVGMLLAEAVVWAVTLKIIVFLRHWTIITHVCIWLSLFAFYMVLLILNTFFCPLSAFGDSNPVSTCGTVDNEVLRSTHSWLVVILWVSVVLLSDVAVAYIRRTFYPQPWQILQEELILNQGARLRRATE